MWNAGPRHLLVCEPRFSSKKQREVVRLPSRLVPVLLINGWPEAEEEDSFCFVPRYLLIKLRVTYGNELYLLKSSAAGTLQVSKPSGREGTKKTNVL